MKTRTKIILSLAFAAAVAGPLSGLSSRSTLPNMAYPLETPEAAYARSVAQHPDIDCPGNPYHGASPCSEDDVPDEGNCEEGDTEGLCGGHDVPTWQMQWNALYPLSPRQ